MWYINVAEMRYHMFNILFITTGGTIASSSSDNGLTPKDTSEDILSTIQNISHDYNIVAKDLFALDSSNIQVEEWQQIARCVYDNYQDYDGIVLTHGTDTMGYTASALSFMLRNIPIPVVLTGSQLPISHPLSDGIENLRTAFAMAASKKPGVFLAFNRKIILGTRAVKTKTTSFDAFDSVNMDFVARVDGRGLNIKEHLLPKISGECKLMDKLCKEVFLIKLTPSFNPDVLDMLVSMNYKGVVIEAFGIGGMQFVKRDLTSKLKMLVDANIAVVVSSQCLFESSDFSVYEVGQKALAQGVIEALDMTSEAAYTKLMWAIANSNNLAEIRELFATSLVNEIKI